MVVSINGKRVVEVIATMQQSNKSIPIQLVSSKNNYKNELMSPKQNSYFYDTMAAQILKNIFLKVQTVQWMDIMSIRLCQSQRIYFLCPIAAHALKLMCAIFSYLIVCCKLLDLEHAHTLQ